VWYTVFMSRNKFEERNVRKLNKTGGTSYSVVLPIEFIREFGWREHQKVVVRKDGRERLVIEDWKK